MGNRWLKNARRHLPRKIKKSLALFLVVQLVWGCTPTPKWYTLPETAPMRLGTVDSRTYTNYLEKEKRYNELLELYNNELNAIKLAQMSYEAGDLLYPQERTSLGQVLSPIGSADPEKDFLRMRQFDTDRGTYDPEGQLYLLDDMAHLHTHWLVNFKKAQQFNREARDLYEALKDRGIDSVPVSSYFNKHRALFYTFFVRPFYAPWTKDSLPGGYHLFPGRVDLVTPFDDPFIRTVRRTDWENLGRRIEQREQFLRNKLGEAPAGPPASVPSVGTAGEDVFTQWLRFTNTLETYSPFERYFLQAAHAFRTCRLSAREPQDLENVIASGEEALEAERPATLEAQHEQNLLTYWLTLAYLEKGMFERGVACHKKLLQGIDRLEELEEQNYQRRQEVVEEVDREEKIRARSQAAFNFLMMAAALAMGAYSSYSGVGGTSAAQQAGQLARQYLDQSIEALAEDRIAADLRTELSKYLSPYSMQLNRYMDKYAMVEYLLALGKGYEGIGDRAEAVSQYDEAIKIIERQRSTISTESQRISFFSAKQELYNRVIPLLIRSGKPERALEYAERAKSRAFVDLLGSRRIKLKSAAHTELYEDRTRTQAEIDTLVSDRALGTEQLNYLVDRLQRGIAVKQKAPSQSLTTDLELQTLSTVKTLGAKEIQALATRATAILEYFVTEDALIIFVIRNDGIQGHVTPMDPVQLLEMAQAWRESILLQTDARFMGRMFFELLIQPVADAIVGHDLVIIPHGVLHYLPFQAIYDGKRYLIERAAISLAPSATVLSLTEAKASIRNNRALIIGNPTQNLDFAENEARAISNLFPNSQLLLGREATPAVFTQQAADYEFIHFATHGEFDPVKPFNSRILLAPDPSGKDSLNMSDLFAQNWQASIVTLSACETGLSRIRGGDELIGMQRAIFFAGARSLLASLWPVDDEATGILMQRFYENLSDMPKNLALQSAQQSMLEDFPDPYFWTAFSLTGARQ